MNKELIKKAKNDFETCSFWKSYEERDKHRYVKLAKTEARIILCQNETIMQHKSFFSSYRNQKNTDSHELTCLFRSINIRNQ